MILTGPLERTVRTDRAIRCKQSQFSLGFNKRRLLDNFISSELFFPNLPDKLLCVDDGKDSS